jgi:diguanylate cyclase (GGDEF)-like protein/PAS domain S-box-containing protein
MTGFSQAELVGARPPYPFWPQELREATEELRRRIVEAQGGEFELTLMRADGERFPAAVRASWTDLGDGRRVFLNTARDVTDQRRHLDQLTALTAVARAIGHSDPLDARHTICRVALQVCPAANRATIWEVAGEDRLVATSMEPAIGDTHVIEDRPEHGASVALRTARPVFVRDAADSPQCDRRLVAQFGVVSVHFQPIADASGVRGVLAIGFPERVDALAAEVVPLVEFLAGEAAVAMERADLLARLDALTRTDDLTGLPNRRAWDELLERELHSARRHDRPVSVAMLDLDHFKAYNDQRGHLAGDRLLQAAAAAWQDGLRITDVLARWGGEEFALLLPGCDAACAVALVERLRGTLPDGVTFSAGVTEWDGVATTRALVAGADRALYVAKENGRDRIELVAGGGLQQA